MLWQLTISYSKCNLLELGRHNLCQPFHIASNSLNYNQSTRDLGVIIDTNLKFQEHINLITKQANQRANLIHRCFLSKDSLNLTRAFKTYVRPLLEYDSSVWTPYNKNLIESIEAVQRSFTKRIPGCQKLSYGERLAKLNLQSLEHRRLLTDWLTCYNIVHGFTSLTFDNFFTFAANRFNTRGHVLKLTIPLDKANIRKYFFSSRVIKPWNSLPEKSWHLKIPIHLKLK